MARLFSQLGVGSMVTLGFLSFISFVPFERVSAAPIACTGSASGSAGTCSTIANCDGTIEPAQMKENPGLPDVPVCPDQWICCIESSSGGTKPPKDVTDPPTTPPGDGNQAPGVANQGTSCTVPTGGTGQCEFTDQCSAANQVPTSSCLGGTVCCVLPATGGGPGINCGGTCRTVTNGCQAPETSISGNCGTGQVCCGVPTGGGQSECALAGGSCRTVGFGCMPTETSSPLNCLSGGQVCCMLPGATGTGGTNTSTGSLNCTGNYQKVAGVCFPKGTGLSEKSVLEIIAALVSWLLAIFGFIALLGFIISGIQYLLSTGDEGMAETAKRNMKYSIIGIIVALSGWIIIKAVDALLNASSLI